MALTSLGAHADIFAVFREPDGSTKWQYVANTSAGVLIIILVVVLVFLFRAHRRAVRWNRAITDIKATLEQRVAQRTAVLQQTTEQLQEREAYIASIVNSMPVMLIGLSAPPVDPLFVSFQQEEAVVEEQQRQQEQRQSNLEFRRACDEADQRPSVLFPSTKADEPPREQRARRQERQRERAAAKKAKAARKRAQAQRRRAA